ncbi:MAG: quinol:electron acceptor oxidoreductase subunit ActD [Bryobacteraceae bacterium]
MAFNASVMGIYPEQTTVTDSVAALHKAGYRSADISVLSSDNQGTKDFGLEHRNRAFEMAGVGAAVGAIAGAILAWFLSNQTLTIPIANLGPVVAAGPIMAVLAGAAAVGAFGWLAGALAGSAMPAYVAKRYRGRRRQCGILLSVHCDSPEWCARAKKILNDTGARNISSTTEAGADYGSTDRPTERPPVPVAVVTRVDPPVETTTVYSSTDTRP